MKSIYLVLLVALICTSLSKAVDLHIGNNTLVYYEQVKTNPIPFASTTKNVFYTALKVQPIRMISVIDNKKSKANVSVSTGGLGYDYVNIRIKSEYGTGLDYLVLIYA